jgi:hypothetical protein
MGTAIGARMFDVFEIIEQVWNASRAEEEASDSRPQAGKN